MLQPALLLARWLFHVSTCTMHVTRARLCAAICTYRPYGPDASFLVTTSGGGEVACLKLPLSYSRTQHIEAAHIVLGLARVGTHRRRSRVCVHQMI